MITKIFCDIDDFMKEFEGLYKQKLLEDKKNNMDKLLLRKRSVIETVNDQLKNMCDIEHTRHRSPINAMVNLVAGLIRYTYLEKKPAINFSKKDREILNEAMQATESIAHVKGLLVA